MALIFVLILIECWCLKLICAQCPADGDVHSYGSSCQYMCHCHGNEQCDTSGDCSSGCAPGWMGPSCQYGNIAYQRTTSQTDTAESLHSSLAVDGDKATCTKTMTQSDAIWSVDLGEENIVVGLVIIVPERELAVLDGYTIYVANHLHNHMMDDNICYWKEAGTGITQLTQRHEINCLQPTQGQYVVIHKRSSNVELELCEVQIYGGRELAFRMPSTQSSIYEESVGEHLANDGSIIDDAISTCSATDISTNPFWQVDLGRVYSIFRIIIYNIDDLETRGALTGFQITIARREGDENSHQHIHEKPTTDKKIEIILKEPHDGRYITIQLPGEQRQLVLCGVEVYGDCPIDFCGTDCYNQCWCNTTVTGNALISIVCPYGCSNLADPSSSPKCNIEGLSVVVEKPSQSDTPNDITTIPQHKTNKNTGTSQGITSQQPSQSDPKSSAVSIFGNQGLTDFLLHIYGKIVLLAIFARSTIWII